MIPVLSATTLWGAVETWVRSLLEAMERGPPLPRAWGALGWLPIDQCPGLW